MTMQDYSKWTLKEPLTGATVQTFVKGYRGQSQMNVNTVNSTSLSSDAFVSLEDVYSDLKN